MFWMGLSHFAGAHIPEASNPIIVEDITAIIRSELPWQSLSGATVLVTGAAGFLPAYLVETLLSLNKSVLARPTRIVALVRNVSRARRRFAAHCDRDDLEIIEHDVSNPLVFAEPFHYVIHAASQASPMVYLADPVGTLSANVLGTHHLLYASRSSPIRGFLFVSSGAVYGVVKNGTASLSEHEGGFLDPIDDRSCYAESKRIGETMCAAWAQQFGIPTRIVRPWHTYGPGMSLDDGRVFADFVRDILNGGPIVLKSDGTSRRSFCYLADAVLGFFTVLLRGSTGEAYNVANPDGECSIAELADRLAELYRHEGLVVQRKNEVSRGDDSMPVMPLLPNVDKLKALGWHSSWKIEEGFKRTVESYRCLNVAARRI